MVNSLRNVFLLVVFFSQGTHALGQFDPVAYLSTCNSDCDCCCKDGLIAPYSCYADWRGTYFGARGGWSWLAPQPQGNLFIPASAFQQPNSDDIFAGLYFGKNFQYKRLVFGFEADFNDTDLNKVEPCNNPFFNCGFKSDWNASFRGRLGVARNKMLFYGTGGYAVSDFEGFTQFLPTATTFRDRETLDGFAVGGGMEYMYSCRIRLRAECIHEGFGTESFQYDSLYTNKPVIDMLSVGMTYKF